MMKRNIAEAPYASAIMLSHISNKHYSYTYRITDVHICYSSLYG
jgi:hypothetical protein